MGAMTPAFAQDEEVTDEIVVTATGRAAALQDVPVAVTAVDADTLENTGANDLRDVTQVAPSLQMGTGQSNSSGTIARIRGIGTGSDNPGFEAAVGIFVDGVYRARAGAALADLPDLERVEVLRGPQGTLFGRNTSAGAISVITAGPEFDPCVRLKRSAHAAASTCRSAIRSPSGSTARCARATATSPMYSQAPTSTPQSAVRCAARCSGT
jgi:outer membrane receptor protein involved in Fe transport